MARDPMKAAEALFKPKVPTLPAEPATSPSLPGAKETVSLAIDQDVLAFFQKEGPGWRERINAALRKAVGI